MILVKVFGKDLKIGDVVVLSGQRTVIRIDSMKTISAEDRIVSIGQNSYGRMIGAGIFKNEEVDVIR